MRFSFSMLDSWMSCPLKAKFRYFDRLPSQQNAKASFGTCIHKALEYYNTSGDLKGAEELFKDYWTNPDKLNVEPDIWPRNTTFGGLMSAGLDVLRDHHTKNAWEKRQVLATEFEFIVPMGEHSLYGFVDLLEIKQSKTGKATVRLVDYKTNSKAPYQSNLRLNVQFTAYSYASTQPMFWMGGELDGKKTAGLPNGDMLFDLYKPYARRGIWYGLMQGREFDAGERDDADYLRMYRAMNEIAKAVDNDVFVPNISGDSCTFCDYVVECKLPIRPRDYNPDTEF